MSTTADVIKSIENLSKDQTYLIAFSGGSDSLCLLYAFHELGFNVKACHVQHGEEFHRKQFADFCKQVCDDLKIPFFLKKVTINSQSSWEASARHERYKALYEVDPKAILVTAHHLDDQIETFFLKFLRGCGIHGLSCMETYGTNPVNMQQILVRPFLKLEKKLLEYFLMERGLEWIQDPSNNSADYDRNFLRLDILPLLETRWPEYRKAVAATIENCQQNKHALLKCLPPQPVSLSLAREWSEAQLSAWVMNCFATLGNGKCPSRAQVKEFVRQVKSDSGNLDNKKYEIQSGGLTIKKIKNSLEFIVDK